MELPNPKSKKHCRLPGDLPLPVVLKKDGSLKKFTAYFNGFSVIVDDPEDMKTLISKGYFGKANFSRSYPQFLKTDQPRILRKRQFVNRENNCLKSSARPHQSEKVIVVPDSDSENEYFENMMPKYEIDFSGLRENVWLGMEEAFFLANVLKCLNIKHKNSILEIDELWKVFQSVQPNFARNYIVYYYYRSKNWVVKPGIKFGGDFLLYKQGPPFYHATYVVVTVVIDHFGQTIETLTNRSMDNLSILSLNRLCETSGKELLICQVKWPQDVEINYNDFTNIEIKEILVRRWIASQERELNK